MILPNEMNYVRSMAFREQDEEANQRKFFRIGRRQHCNNFIRTYKDEMLTQFQSDYPKIKLKHFVCVDNETGKEIQRQLYGDGDNDNQS